MLPPVIRLRMKADFRSISADAPPLTTDSSARPSRAGDTRTRADEKPVICCAAFRTLPTMACRPARLRRVRQNRSAIRPAAPTDGVSTVCRAVRCSQGVSRSDTTVGSTV